MCSWLGKIVREENAFPFAVILLVVMLSVRKFTGIGFHFIFFQFSLFSHSENLGFTVTLTFFVLCPTSSLLKCVSREQFIGIENSIFTFSLVSTSSFLNDWSLIDLSCWLIESIYWKKYTHIFSHIEKKANMLGATHIYMHDILRVSSLACVFVCMTAMIVVGEVFYVNKVFTHEFSLFLWTVFQTNFFNLCIA